MRRLILFSVIASLTLISSCGRLGDGPSENQIKSDLIGKSLVIKGEKVWNFDALAEFETFSIEDVQRANEVAEITISSQLMDHNTGQKYSASYVCTYKTQGDKWSLVSVAGKTYELLPGSSSQPNEITDVENIVRLAEGKQPVVADKALSEALAGKSLLIKGVRVSNIVRNNPGEASFTTCLWKPDKMTPRQPFLAFIVPEDKEDELRLLQADEVKNVRCTYYTYRLHSLGSMVFFTFEAFE